ncbi:MAG: RagB/SusD family nutrient uptake outer membrane protein [Bacteroidota bacterium]|nr:RagB/SusD family nutrient uptake outer membrane protein [Bacteroidota bacterium]
MKNKYIFSLLTGILLMASSCQKNKYLNPASTTSLPDFQAFDTPDRILSQVRGLYGTAKSGTFLGGRFSIYNDVRADNFINETNNAVTALQTWNFTVNNNAQETTGCWAQAYLAINNCNLFLEGMAGKGNTVAGATLAANYNAEAKFVRALCYYSLLQLYARPYWDGNGSKPGLPLRLTGNKNPGDYNLARSTVDDVYKQILKDLDEAETGLPLTYSSAVLNTTRAHRNTAIALKTRVYLSMGKYDKVITEANKIVSATAPFTATTGVNHALQADITTVFKTPYTTTESILSFPFLIGADVPGTQNQLGYYFGTANGSSVAGANGEFSLNAAGVIADPNWKATDKRRNFIYTATTGKKYLTKYAAGSPFTDYAPAIRYSEVLLNLAEALVRVNNTVDPQAVALLSAVRSRSDATTTYTVASFADATALINAILQERNIEFLAEGRRSPDLLRLGLTIPAKSTVPAIPSSDSRYIWPISANELLYNHLCVDN